MTNPFAHDPDCAYWFDHYESECSCSRLDQNPPPPAMRTIRDELAELKRRIAVLEARVTAGKRMGYGAPDA
jgi:hypothetical protein